MDRAFPHSRTNTFLFDEIRRNAWQPDPQPITAAAPVATQPMVSIKPITGRESTNVLRPHTLDEMIGQDDMKPLLKRLTARARATGKPMPHMLLIGERGTGKTTVSMAVANAMDTRVFLPKPPLDMAMLETLRTTARDGDVIFIDEIHLQVSGGAGRRGIGQPAPEDFYALLEDGMLATVTGPLSFPKVTWIGATTDIGLVPQAMSDRFPIQPSLDPYTLDQMTQIAVMNARALKLDCAPGVPAAFAAAARNNPRQVNNYFLTAEPLACGETVTMQVVKEVVHDMGKTTPDGLTRSMQKMLTTLCTDCRRVKPTGEVVYEGSVNLLATACGHGRDTKAINLLVEPELIRRGLLQVRPSGRGLTDAGVQRARQLLEV